MPFRPFLLASVVLSLAGACGSSSLGGSESCQQLLQDYDNAYPAALACDPGASGQCQQQAPPTGGCDCGSYVQDPTQLNIISAKLQAAGCIPSKQVECPCPVEFPLACVANDGGGGTCTSEPLTPS